MNKVLSFFLLFLVIFGSLFPNMDTCEFSKIPELISHYQEHKEKSGESIQFIDFIALHYGTGIDSDTHRKQENHEKLPFQEHSFHVAVLALTEPVSFSFYKFQPISVLNTSYFYSEYSEYSVALLLPPKV